MPVKQIININLPGSKSYTNRALICAALACGRTRLFGFGKCEDALMMAEALRKMGVKIKNLKLKIKEYLEIEGGVRQLLLPEDPIYVGNAGTAMRFLITLLGLIVNNVKIQNPNVKSMSKSKCSSILTGSKRMQERPVGDLLEALGELGIKAKSIKKNGCPPVKFLNSKFQDTNKFQISNSKFQIGGKIKLRGDASSQYLSSILLCAPYFDKDTEIEIIGQLTSKPYVDMTIEVMNKFDVQVDNQDYKIFKVKSGQKHQPRDYQIEPDASGAGYFMAGAALTGQWVRFPGLRVMSKQGDVKFAKVLAKCQMSNFKSQNQISNLKTKDPWLEFYGTRNLRGIIVDMNAMPDLVPTLAVLAMFAKGKTVIRNVANLRIKECDRLRALATEIRKFGIQVSEFDDGLEIVGKPNLRIAICELRISTYNDHRMAMAFAVAKLVIPDIIIEDQGCVRKSFPRFWQEWHKMEL